MADKDERKVQATKHESLMKGVFASETAASVEAAVIYEDGEGRELDIIASAGGEGAGEATETEAETAGDTAAEATETLVTSAFAPEAIYRFGLGKTMAVDPASFTRPGGAYEDGAFGPEQILCSESNLYQILCGIKGDYHDKNRDYRCGMLFTDRAAFLPNVTFSYNGTVRKADVIAVAEPLRARAIENHRSERECDNALANRIETLLRIAAANGCETLVLGAFGCGRLGYDVQQVIGLFKAWIDRHPGAIARIVFAVPRAYFDAFDQAFGKHVEKKPAQAEPIAPEDDEDDFDPADLPEGVTFRG